MQDYKKEFYTDSTFKVYTKEQLNVECIEQYKLITHIPRHSIVITDKGNIGVVIESEKYRFISNGKEHITSTFPVKGTNVELINPTIAFNTKQAKIAHYKLKVVGKVPYPKFKVELSDEETNKVTETIITVPYGKVIEDYLPENKIILTITVL